MLSVRVTGPSDVIARVLPDLEHRETVCGLIHIPGVAQDGKGDVLVFDVAREDVNAITALLEEAGIQESGGIVLVTPTAVVSDAADAAERAAPGSPDDGVVWDQIADEADDSARPSVGFLVFLVLAALIAGVGRIQDQPILIVGAMVVGPEFAPISSICFAIAFGRLGMGVRAALTLIGGFALAVLVSWGAWALAHGLGAITYSQGTTGRQTAFIVQPDPWSFVIAVLAGIAGVLSLTTSKSSAMVGVFISITTIPAVGVMGLTLALGAHDQTWQALGQLAINVAGLIVAGVATLLVQRALGPHLAPWLVRARFQREAPRTSPSDRRL